MPAGLRVCFIHPDLGIGGAERLVVDAALQLQKAGHKVTILTAHHDTERCFEETKNGALDVQCISCLIPLHLAQRLRAPCTIARTSYVAVRLLLRHLNPSIIFCDTVPHPLPLLRAASSAKILYYCHFPDQLLTPPRHGIYSWYRKPLDWSEGSAIAYAHRVLVNSYFTKEIFQQTFSRLRSVVPEVLYPAVDPANFLGSWEGEGYEGKTMLLSLNRFERKKNLHVAIDAFAALRKTMSATSFASLHLVIAGGYDDRLRECGEVFSELQQRVSQLSLGSNVTFLRSIDEVKKRQLLSQCRCLVYTPPQEHFGYGPIEAMASGRPVVAVRSGGPAETILDGVTGFLSSPDSGGFASALQLLLQNRDLAQRMGEAARKRVSALFSHDVFGERLGAIVQDLTASG